MSTPCNSLDISQAGLVKFDGISTFTGVTTTNHNILLGAASNGITSVAPSATSGVPLVSTGASADPAFGTAVVAGGGTGRTSLTAHTLLAGNGTSAITQIAVGATGTILNGHTGADPSFDTQTVGSYTFTKSTASQSETLTVSQTDNTSGSSEAVVAISSGGTNGGDPYLRVAQGTTQSYCWGIDHTDAFNTLKIRSGASGTSSPSSGDGVCWQTTKNGVIRTPFQPGVSAFVHTAQTNVTGDGTSFDVIWDSTSWQQGSNYSAVTGKFTVPADGGGLYLVSYSLTFSGITALDTSGEFGILSSAGTVTRKVFNPGTALVSGQFQISDLVIGNFSAGDTIYVNGQISGSTKTVSTVADSFGPFSYFNVMKIA